MKTRNENIATILRMQNRAFKLEKDAFKIEEEAYKLLNRVDELRKQAQAARNACLK